MNAIQMLIKDHEEVKGLFGQFREAGERAKKKKQTIAQKVMQELKVHTELEERIFYPQAREKGGKELKKTILEGIEEHHVVDFLMEKLQGMQPEDETFDAVFKVLMENVEHHVQEEEKEMFPEAKKALGEDLDRLGAEMEALKKQMQA